MKRREFLKYCALLLTCSRTTFVSQDGIYENAAKAVVSRDDWSYVLSTIETRSLDDKNGLLDLFTDIFLRLPKGTLESLINRSRNYIPLLRTAPGVSNDPRTYLTVIAARKSSPNDPLLIARRILEEDPEIINYVDINKDCIEFY